MNVKNVIGSRLKLCWGGRPAVSLTSLLLITEKVILLSLPMPSVIIMFLTQKNIHNSIPPAQLDFSNIIPYYECMFILDQCTPAEVYSAVCKLKAGHRRSLSNAFITVSQQVDAPPTFASLGCSRS